MVYFLLFVSESQAFCRRMKHNYLDKEATDWLIGFPMCLSHQKYYRNALLFNVCFVLDGTTEPRLFYSFEGVVQKLARYFATLEIESGTFSFLLLFSRSIDLKVPL